MTWGGVSERWELLAFEGFHSRPGAAWTRSRLGQESGWTEKPWIRPLVRERRLAMTPEG